MFYKLTRIPFGPAWILYAPALALIANLARTSVDTVKVKPATDGSSMGKDYQ